MYERALVTVPLNGTSYTATVRAQNAFGSSPVATAASQAATAPPPPVTSLRATPLVGGAALTWTAAAGTAAVAAPDWFVAQAWGPNNSFIQTVGAAPAAR